MAVHSIHEHHQSQAEYAQTLMSTAYRLDRERAQRMPDHNAALRVMLDAYLRLKALGWREAMYAPKDGRAFEGIEAGSCGTFRMYCTDNGRYCWAEDGGDIYPAHPILFREIKGDQCEERGRNDDSMAHG